MRPLALAAQALPLSCSVDDYNDLAPASSLLANSGAEAPAQADFGAGHTVQQRGEALAGMRQDAFDAEALVLRGITPCAGLYPGGKTTLSGCPEKDMNREWLVTGTEIECTGSDRVRLAFTALPAAVRYRPRPDYSRPRLHGPLTGVVTGKQGEEIWTDEHGRVKVRLHWDHAGSKDEKASCWMRVAQPWAGAGYGAFFLPRVGQEVVVSFLDGDPNRPLVTGALCNAANAPPWALPGKHQHSGIRGRSTPNGKGEGNEICLDDTADNERLYFHAQKLLDCVVEEARTATIKGEGGDSLILEQGDLSITVQKGKAATYVKGDYTLTVDGNFTLAVKGDIAMSTEKGLSLHADEALSGEAGKGMALKAGEAFTLKAGGDMAGEAGKNLTLNAAAALTATGAAKVQIQTDGAASAEFQSSGVVTVKGSMVNVG